MASVIPPDLELFLTGWLRSNITDVAGLQVGNRIPDDYDGTYPLVPGGRTYKLPLSMSIDDFTRLSNTSDDTESVEQLKRILSAFAGDKQAKALNGEPVQVVFNLLSDYGDAVVRAQGASLGKSNGSPSSSPNTGA